MKRYFTLPVVLALAAIPSFASYSQNPFSSQFHVASPTKQAAANTRNAHRGNQPASETRGLPTSFRQGRAHFAKAKFSSRNIAGPATIGFVSATEIAAGGSTQQGNFMADVNGDGKADIVGLVRSVVSGNSVYSISVALGNGDGTSQAPALTTLTTNDPILVGDLNGDGKADVIQVHSGSNSSLDVWLSDTNGDAKFTHAAQGATFGISATSLQGAILTDLNADGKLNVLAIDTTNPGLVWTILGNGDGTFQTGTSTALAGQSPDGLVFADFNADGKVDFAGLNYTTEQVDVYLQSVGGFLQQGSDLVSPNAVYDTCNLAAGDLTGDGKAEIVSTNCGDQNLTVYVNNGDGSFQTGVYYGSAAAPGSTNAQIWPIAATIADVNGDGKADILVSNIDGSDITVLLGHGDGTVTVPTVGYAVGGYPGAPPLVGDFNGDGKADIVVGDREFSYVYLPGYGDGTFRSALNYYGAAANRSYGLNIVSGDFNGDGKPDFVLSGCCDSSIGIAVFLSRADGSLMPAVNYGSGGSLQSVAVADFNGDGKLDVAATVSNAAAVQIFTGVGDGTFTTGNTFPSDSANEAFPLGIVAGDFNHDGHIDLAVANGFDIGILLGDGTANFSAPTNYSLSQYALDLTAADVNGDGYLDLIAPLSANPSNGVALFLGATDNSGTFGPEADVAAGFNSNFSAAAADLNADAKLDLVFTVNDNTNGHGIAVALGNGDGTFQAPALFPTSLQDSNLDHPYPAYLKIFDLNADGKPDLIVTNSQYGTLATLFGVGNGTFSVPHEYASGGYAFGLALADVNGDGATDVITAGDDFLGATVLLNDSGSGTLPTFTVAAVSSTATVPAGTPATYDLTLTGKNGYQGTVTFACSGLPAKATCSFNPASVAVSGAVPFATVVTITTAVAHNSDPDAVNPGPKTGGSSFWGILSGLGLFGMFVVGGTRKNRRRTSTIVGSLLLLGMMLALAGCGTTTPGTPKGTYTVTVTATGTGSNAPVQTMPLTLVVQ